MQLDLYEIAQNLCSWCKGYRSLKLGAFPARSRYVVSAHSHVVHMTRRHSHLVQLRATVQDSRLPAEAE